MALKRHLSFRDGDVGSQQFPLQAPKRRLSFATVVRDIMRGLSLHEVVTKLEPFLRSVVRDEVERRILHHSSPRSSFNLCDSFQARDWQLHFDDRLPPTLFTFSNIESVDNKPVKIVVIDASSKKIMASGPLSSIKVEIVVLDGDFGGDDLEDWTEREFNANIVREREGKRPLVTGELVVPLRDGVGYIGDVVFTDNSSWIRSRRFRLGARIVQSISTIARIREARSEAFVVKDHRGESYKKHHPPNLGDEIWRLERIGKDGAFHKRLADKGITTVKDFLRSYYVDPSSLRNILGGGISNRSWETIIKHATDCALDDKFYYWDEEGVQLVFNSVLKVVKVSFDGQNYQSPDKLNGTQMGLVENLKPHAYKKLDLSAPHDEVSGFGPSMLPSSLLADPFSSSSLSLPHVNFPGVHPDHQEMHMALSHIKTSMPYNYDVQDGRQLDVPVAQHHHPTQVFTPTSGNSLMAMDSWSGPYNGGDGWAPIGSLGPPMHNSQVGTSTWQRNDELFFAPSNEAHGILSSNFGKHKARWCMIRAVVKWGISVRRDVAAKKWQDLFT